MPYHARAFARLTGVTIKALRHYERRGLLSPRRTAAGHRRYTLQDLRRVDEILALKSLGLPLVDVKRVAEGGDVGALVAHRARLADARSRIDEAIRAIDGVTAEPESPAALRRLFANASWERWEARRSEASQGIARPPDRVSGSRLDLFREIVAALDAGTSRDAGTSDEAARAFRDRWDALLLAECDGNTEAMRRLKRIWSTRRAWPDGAVRYIASLYDTDPATWERFAAFLDRE